MRCTASSVVVLFAAVAMGGCTTRSNVVGKTAEGAEIVEISFPLSNAFLIKSPTPVLIDAGTEDDMPALNAALAKQGLEPKQLGLVIVTHGHFDHAGLASALKRLGVRVMLGAGDLPLARGGHNDELRPTNATADTLKWVLPSRYPAFEPDEIVTAPVDLSRWGLAGQVIPMPGHTAGSLVVVLANKSAFVGDQMLGGILGGAFCPDRPTEHYFQADLNQNHANIRALIRLGIETFYLGHGGPVKRAAVMDEFGF